MKYECEACKTCEDWNNELKCCDFNGICELCVNSKYLDKEYELLEH